MNIKCAFSHNLDLESAGLLHCPIWQGHPLSLVFNPHRAAGSARSPLPNGKLYYLFWHVCELIMCFVLLRNLTELLHGQSIIKWPTRVDDVVGIPNHAGCGIKEVREMLDHEE
jgi:hypothetical protein